jgi:hypothetical protein
VPVMAKEHNGGFVAYYRVQPLGRVAADSVVMLRSRR